MLRLETWLQLCFDFVCGFMYRKSFAITTLGRHVEINLEIHHMAFGYDVCLIHKMNHPLVAMLIYKVNIMTSL